MGCRKQTDLGDWLKGLREQAGVTRTKMDSILAAVHNLSSGYTASLENGRFKMPDRDVCNTIADAIGAERDYVWTIVAWDRLRCFDADLYSWFREIGVQSACAPILEENKVLRAKLAAIRAQTEGL